MAQVICRHCRKPVVHGEEVVSLGNVTLSVVGERQYNSIFRLQPGIEDDGNIAVTSHIVCLKEALLSLGFIANQVLRPVKGNQ